MPRNSQTRERLIATAAELVQRRGFAATGLAEILSASGAGSGSLYHYFRNKEDLLCAVLDSYQEAFEQRIAAPARAASEDPIQRVFALLDFYRRYLEENGCSRGCPVGNLACEVADTHPELRQRIAGLFDLWSGEVRHQLEAASDRLPADADPESLSHFVLAVMEGGVMQARTQRDVTPYGHSVARLRDYFDRLLADQTQAKDSQP